MKRVVRGGIGVAVLATAAFSVTVAGVDGSAHQEPQRVASTSVPHHPKLRVLMAGDSITQGFNGDYTWRFRLWQEFRRQHVPVNFVGSRHLPFVQEGFDTSSYADPHFDTDHFAITGTMLSSLAARIRGEVTRERPDVLVLEAGVNDLLHGRTPEQTDQALREAITQARAAAPDLKIVVLPVLGVQRSRPVDIHEQIRAYDALLRATVSELSTTTSPVVIAHTRDGWDVERDTYAGLHPNPTGEALIAGHVAEALVSLGVLTEEPGSAPDDVWRRNLEAVVADEGGRAVVTWDTQALTGARLRWREAGGVWRVVPRDVADGHFETRLLAAGTYEFQLQAVRKRMISPYGPTTTLTVP
ncbi:hypothetical protein D9V37_12940 [Nocardioides mangrovicus]|uniref:SGNH hydrolase-type esterase domain-containing protein n=1 Tax=Nocardioides mangrovicus TaxID=2478913 RepID=A0A3L8NZL7_9ACTN|nr:GDSL-type esterase/lipase family protein [Nocardioides mangrovicus]RLV48646.1 hypothetical protein D9V37_12940 [Nocardioides mangrovicus]